VVNKQLEETDT